MTYLFRHLASPRRGGTINYQFCNINDTISSYLDVYSRTANGIRRQLMSQDKNCDPKRVAYRAEVLGGLGEGIHSI